MDDDTVNVASRAHTAIRIQEPLPEEYKDRPGDAPPLREVVINGSNHSEVRGGEGITRGVHAGMFRSWFEAYKRSNHPLAGLFREISGDELEQEAANENGFEPGLTAMADAGDADRGSTITHEGPLTADEMAAHSDTPNDDSPRSDPDGGMVAHAQVPATDVTRGAEEHHEERLESGEHVAIEGEMHRS